MPQSRRQSFLAAAFSLIAGIGCNGSGSFDPEKSPYGEPTPTTVMSLKETSGKGATIERVSKIVGTKTVAGKTFSIHRVGDAEGTAGTGTEFYFNRTAQTFEVGGFTDNRSVGFTFDKPLTVGLDPPIGATQALSGTGLFQLLPSTMSIPVTVSSSGTLVAADETVDTPMGRVHGCKHYSATGTATGDQVPAIANALGTVEAWYHPQFGLVKARVPGIGWSTDMASTGDCGETSVEYNTIRKVGIIDKAHPVFTLDSYDCDHGLLADKDTHAQMLLELRWLDEAKAKTATEPGYPATIVEVGTVMGVYPFTLTKSPVSVFHPEENGQGYTYWLAFVNQAAKNEPVNGIAYHIKVRIDGDIVPSLRATARIHYRHTARP